MYEYMRMLQYKWVLLIIILSTSAVVQLENEMHENADPIVSQFMGISNKIEEKNPSLVRQKENSKIQLDNFPIFKDGMILEIDNGHRRERRSNGGETCGMYGNVTELKLSMDFSSGKVKVDYICLPNVTHGRIALYNKNEEEIERNENNLTKSTGSITLYSLMNQNYSAKYVVDENTYLDTGKWNQCGFNWTILNKLPSSYGTVRIRVQIQNGAPYVCLRHSGSWVPNSNDWLMVQPIVNITSNQRGSNWQPISNFTSAGTNTECKKFARLDASFKEGFRVKYIYNDGSDQYEGPDDNSSPSWDQNTCSVSRVVPFEGNNHNPTTTQQTTDGNNTTNDISGGKRNQSKIILFGVILVLSVVLFQN